MTDRLQDSLKAILAALMPTIAYFGEYEYVVTNVVPIVVPPSPLPLGTPVLIDCVATDPPVLATFPTQLAAVPLWPGPSGLIAIPRIGTNVRIGFINANPGKPIVRGLDPSSLVGSPLISFAAALSVALTTPQVAAAGALLLSELTT